MFNREKAIEALINNDYDDIMEGMIPNYLIHILTNGFEGYKNLTDEQLNKELMDREELND
jgi:hypothetical protein